MNVLLWTLQVALAVLSLGGLVLAYVRGIARSRTGN
jgi:hypothetical protein